MQILFLTVPIGGKGENAAPANAVEQFIEAIEKGDMQKAKSLMDSLPSALPPNVSEKINQIIDRRQPGSEWIAFLDTLTQKYPSNPDFTYTLAHAYWRAGNIEATLQNCRKSLQLSPQNPTLLYQCAALAQTVGRTGEAKEWLSTLISLKPDDPDGLFLLGRTYSSEGDYAKAEPLLQHAIQVNAKHYLAYFELGRLKNQTNAYGEAEQNLAKAVQIYPFFREAYNALLTVYARQKKQNSINELKPVVDHLVYWDAVKEERLRNSFLHASQINAQDGYELATELCFVKRYDLARKYLEKVVGEGQSGEPFLFLLGQLRFRDRDYAGCLALFDRLKHPRATDSKIYAEQKAWSLLETGCIEEAKAFLAGVLPKFQDSESLQTLTKRLEQQGQATISSTIESSMKEETNKKTKEELTAAFRFVDVTEKAGLNAFKHIQGNPDKRWIIDVMGSGVAVSDYDKDGDDDIYFVNAQPDVNHPDPKIHNALFRNEGGRFVDVTDQAGVGDPGYGMCASFGDIDNNGFPDLFVGNYGQDRLYKNNGDGTFTDITEKAGVGDPGYAAASAFGDVNKDGWLDLFVGNYVAFDPKTNGDKRDMYHGIPVFAGPLTFSSQEHKLYINRGDGTFEESGKKAGINATQGRAMGCSFVDFDGDGNLDLYVSNDSTSNHVLRNKGDGTFEDISYQSGGAFNESGVAGGSMGVSAGDFNNDGRIDLFVTAYEQMSDVLYRNDGDGMLSDVTTQWGLISPSHWLITWGSGFCDFDADGWLDLYTANGHIYPQIDSLGLGRTYKQGVSLYKNSGKNFIDATSQSFSNHPPLIAGRGSALLDYDNDGDMDIVVNCIDSTPLLLENQTPQGHWLKVALDVPNAKSYGVRVTARKDGQRWTRFVDGGSSYLSQNSPTLHFGLGKNGSLDEIIVHWLHREVQIIGNPEIDRLLVVRP